MVELKEYRELLRESYLKHFQKNARYSMRSFARDLELDSGQLSLVLKGKKNISLQKASQLAKALYDNPRDMIIFYQSVELENTLSETRKEEIREQLQRAHRSHADRERTISDEEFEVICNWYNIPILELTAGKEFVVTPSFAATYFGISEMEALLGLEAMRRLGFVKKIDKRYVHIRNVVTTTEVTSFAIRQFHSQMINKAQAALFQQPLDKRYLSGITVLIPQDKLDEVKKMIDEHEQRLSDFALSFAGQSDRVTYQFNSQLFSLRAKDSKPSGDGAH
jgi:uncharacterized protein (TIGR02147 family)